MMYLNIPNSIVVRVVTVVISAGPRLPAWPQSPLKPRLWVVRF
jgi:hypothetical protein